MTTKHARTLSGEAAAMLTRYNRGEREDEMLKAIIRDQQSGCKLTLRTRMTGAGLNRLLHQCKKAGLIFDEIQAGGASRG